MEQKCRIQITVKSTKLAAAPYPAKHKEGSAFGIPKHLPGRVSSLTVTPIKILTSTQTGRRYLCAWQENAHRLSTFRLDSIQNIQLLTPDPAYDAHRKSFQDIFPYVWGVSFGDSPKKEPETVVIFHQSRFP